MNNQPETAERTDEMQDTMPPEPKSKGNLVHIAPPRIQYHPAAKDRFGIGMSEWRVLVDSIFPSAKTTEGILLALAYCQARKLDIMKRPVNVVSVWNSALGHEVESVWPGIGELRTTAHRTGLYAGCDATVFGDDVKTIFSGRVKNKKDWEDVEVPVTHPSWAQITVYRLVGPHRIAFPGPRIMYLASYGKRGRADVPNEKWERSPSYMLEKVAEAAALRKAFPEELGEQLSAEEMEGQIVDHEPGTVTAVHAEPAPPKPTRQAMEQARKEDVSRTQEFKQAVVEETDHDPETGEITADQFAGAASGLTDRFQKASSLKILNELVAKHQPEIEAIGETSPEIAAHIQVTIEARRKHFAR